MATTQWLKLRRISPVIPLGAIESSYLCEIYDFNQFSACRHNVTELKPFN